jgi:glycine cleavage system H protein
VNVPEDLKYTATHEWVREEGDLLVVGITDPAQEMLGDLVFVGEVQVGRRIGAGEVAAVVESVKAAADVYAPAAGEIVAFNEELGSRPELVNRSPYEAWIFKLKPAQPPQGLLDAAAYRATVDAKKEAS